MIIRPLVRGLSGASSKQTWLDDCSCLSPWKAAQNDAYSIECPPEPHSWKERWGSHHASTWNRICDKLGLQQSPARIAEAKLQMEIDPPKREESVHCKVTRMTTICNGISTWTPTQFLVQTYELSLVFISNIYRKLFQSATKKFQLIHAWGGFDPIVSFKKTILMPQITRDVNEQCTLINQITQNNQSQIDDQNCNLQCWCILCSSFYSSKEMRSTHNINL